MDISKENDNCTIIETVPPKQKKLKQALLPFQTLSSPESIGLKNKKRKLSSSSPSSCKNEKISKIARKENLLNVPNDTEINSGSKENEKNHDSSEENEDGEKDKKDEEKNVMKPNALLKYLKKTSETSTSAKSNKLEKNIPIIVLNRCDENIQKDQDNSSQNHKSSDSVTMTENDKNYTIDINDSNNEDSPEIFVYLDKEEDCKESPEGSNENLDNSDTETESSSSEDDENDDKKSNDDVSEVSGRENGSSVERTPTSDTNPERKMHKNRRLTPKQLEKKIESEKKKEERQKLKAEREKQRIEERMERRAKREAEREEKKKEKEQKKLKKQMEIEQKQEEKERKEKAKEEDRRKKEEAKEEEKKKKEEERLEAERKKQKAASTFKSFFVPKNQETKSAVEEKNIGACNFMPFEIKADMKMAPTCRRTFSNDEKIFFDTVYMKNDEETEKLYLQEIKNDKSKIHRSGKTWPVEAKDDVMILEDDDVDSANFVDQTSSVLEKQRPKLIAFSENRRPPYWGTWRKKSRVINPRRPFARDTKYFDYEVHSDDEWEEEEPGESLRGSDDEKEKDEENADENEYDVDNEFMVPHGYLSDEEGRADEEDRESMSPETHKFKLKILGEQFEAEMNEKTAKIKPKVIGCIWQGPLNSYPEKTPTSVINFLTIRQAWVRETPIILEALFNSDSSNNIEALSISKKEKEKSTPGPKKTRLPDTALPDLIRLLHGNPNGRSFLIKEFITYWDRKYPQEEQQLSQISVGKKIRELAKRMLCPEEGPMHLKTCWYVHEDIRKKYVEEELTLPNKWIYKLTPKRKSRVTEAIEPAEKIEKEVDREKEKDQKDKEKEKKTTPLITQFTKKITQEEMKKQLSVKPTPSSTTKPSITPNKPGKRVTLISVARGEQLPKSPIVSAFSKVSQSTKNSECLPGSTNLPITIEDSPEKNDSTLQKTHHNYWDPKTTCEDAGDEESVKKNQSTELNNKPDQMEVEQTE